MNLFIAVEKVLETGTLCPGFPVKTPQQTRRIHLSAVQKQSIQQKITTKQLTQDGQTIVAGTRKMHQSPSKKGILPKLRQQHLFTQDVGEERSQQSFNFVHTVCKTKKSEKLDLVEVSGNLFDSRTSIVHSISEDFKMAAGVAMQVREAFPTTYPEIGLKALKEKIYAQQISLNLLIYHLIDNPRLSNKPTYSSLRVALEAMLHYAQKHKIKKISIPRWSTGLDKLNWLKVKGIITDVFHNSPIKVTVYTQLQQQNSSPSGTHNKNGTKRDMQQAKEV